MTKITPPMDRIPIGVVNVNGQRLEVTQHPEFVRFFRDMFTRAGGVDGWGVEDLRVAPQADSLNVSALTQPADLAQQVAQLREQLATQGDIENQLAQLRETVAYMGLRRKRTVSGSIALGAGTASATYSISPSAASVDLCDFTYLGSTASAAAGTTDAAVSVELTDASTVTARRVGTAGTVTAYFRITEFTQ